MSQIEIAVFLDVRDQAAIAQDLGHDRRQRLEAAFDSARVIDQMPALEIDG
jgi:hypothetical protein